MGTAQCRHCGRVLMAGEWKWDDSVAVVYIGSCPTCARLETQRQDREYRKLEREQPRRVREGKLLTAPLLEDPFKGFKEGGE